MGRTENHKKIRQEAGDVRPLDVRPRVSGGVVSRSERSRVAADRRRQAEPLDQAHECHLFLKS